ncbi:hypothetical protein [Segniliparus rugosus]|uniref:Uncharacterized protein n=1 Tax=Segniliparus rugosus (strain ATCC BAA-974 / DSM 45345 / CCUG 50838 / CIP 108380 / JCM 13579 / CDC 945) TaxID=679197 RepID=E5XPH6_SEGRC|nr:hypothetical protein [Segniliparus rugosus]EFV13739.1 hypothetical protein HMPREF9336_01398 [Segniliparus rugosus ATCC BAA-974]
MGIFSDVQRTAALCLAALVPAGALALPATASAEASAADCAELSTLYSSFQLAIKDVIDQKEVDKAVKNGKADKEAFSAGVAQRLFETDPVTGKLRMDLFLEHLRDLDALAHDADGKLEDPEAAEAVEKLADGLDGYLALIDQLRAEDGEAADATNDAEESGKADPEEAFDDLGPALKGFMGGLDAFIDYRDKADCAA